MIEHIKKITKIIDEITTYFMSSISDNIDIRIERDNRNFKLIFKVEAPKITTEELTELKESLSIPKQEDIEEYYWQLNGAGDSDIELDLIGMMIDEYELLLEKDHLILTLIRKNH